MYTSQNRVRDGAWADKWQMTRTISNKSESNHLCVTLCDIAANESSFTINILEISFDQNHKLNQPLNFCVGWRLGICSNRFTF